MYFFILHSLQDIIYDTVSHLFTDLLAKINSIVYYRRRGSIVLMLIFILYSEFDVFVFLFLSNVTLQKMLLKAFHFFYGIVFHRLC